MSIPKIANDLCDVSHMLIAAPLQLELKFLVRTATSRMLAYFHLGITTDARFHMNVNMLPPSNALMPITAVAVSLSIADNSFHTPVKSVPAARCSSTAC
jgi:hypothetical protein